MSNPTELPDLDLIREVFLRNGFTVKEGQTDLKPYVYAAGAELLALARRAQPESKAPQAAAHRATIEEAAQVLESAAAHNRAKGRTVLERTQQDRADRLRAILTAPAAQHAESGKEPEVRVYQYFDWGRDACHNVTESEWLSVKAEDRHIGLATIAKPEHVQEGSESNG